MFEQYGFQIDRIHVESARDDHVLLPIQQMHETVIVDPADIAAALESRAGLIEPACLASRIIELVVAGHQPWTAADDLAHFALLKHPSVVVNNAKVAVGKRPADSVEFVPMLVGIQ